MGAVLPAHLLPLDEPEVGLIYQGGGLQRVARALMQHVMVRQPVQLVIDERGQFGKGRLVAIAPGDQELRDFFWGVRPHKDLRGGMAQKLSQVSPEAIDVWARLVE